jgi:hypothetical protein
MHSLKILLGLHCMHNSFLNRRSNSFHQISIFLDFVFKSNFEILFWNIWNHEFQFILSKSLTNFQVSIFKKVQKNSFKFKIYLNQSKSCCQIFKSIFFLFLHFDACEAGSPSQFFQIFTREFLPTRPFWPNRPRWLLPHLAEQGSAIATAMPPPPSTSAAVEKTPHRLLLHFPHIIWWCPRFSF